jgi:hypothetical protein
MTAVTSALSAILTPWKISRRSRRPRRIETAAVLDDEDCEVRAVEDYSLVFSSARKPTVPS